MNVRKLLPITILVSFIALAFIVISNPPHTKRGRPNQAPQINVDVLTLVKENVALTISSYGTVKPRTQSILLPQVPGEIMSISPNFRDGGFFEKGDVLLELDDRDLNAEVKIAQSSLFTARQALSEEQARVEQAKQDWLRLGNGTDASDLALRKPQLLAAKAAVSSAEAKLDKAKLALERTKIIAPYRGRILTKKVDVGTIVSSGTQLAEIYAVDYVEIRLPIKNKDLPYIELPESNRLGQVSMHQHPKVTIYSDLATMQVWEGKIVRTEGAFDQNSQQLYVVAQIDDPYGTDATQTLPLKIGQYVTAKIQGKVIKQSIKIPNKAIYQGSYVYLVENNRLLRTEVDIAWQDDQFAVIEKGISAGQLLVLTPLGQVTSGTPVAVNNAGINQQPDNQSNKIENRITKKYTQAEFAQLSEQERKKIKMQRAKKQQGVTQ